MSTDYDGRIDGQIGDMVFEMKPSLTPKRGVHSFVGTARELRRFCDEMVRFDSLLGNPQEWDSKRRIWRRVHRHGR